MENLPSIWQSRVDCLQIGRRSDCGDTWGDRSSQGTSTNVQHLHGRASGLWRTCPVSGRVAWTAFRSVEYLIAAILGAIDHPKAHQQTFNICMDEPVDYGELAQYLAESRGLPSDR